ncbi:hypothetical protein DESA109040_22450 [Deinococcus saxicola]
MAGQGGSVAVHNQLCAQAQPAAAGGQGGVGDDRHASAAGAFDVSGFRLQQPDAFCAAPVAVKRGSGQSGHSQKVTVQPQPRIHAQGALAQVGGQLLCQRGLAGQQQTPGRTLQRRQSGGKAGVWVAAFGMQADQPGIGAD